MNTATPLDSSAIYVSLTSSLSLDKISALLDSGSTHCFVDTDFIHKFSVPTFPVPPIPFKLFDGSSNTYLTQTSKIPVTFPTGESMVLDCYVTPLHPSCSMVLGFNWLFHYNPSVDWKLGRFTFRTPEQTPAKVPPTSPASIGSIPSPDTITPVPPSEGPSALKAPHIALVNSVAFLRSSKLPGSQTFSFNLHRPDVSAKSASPSSEEPVDLSGVPEEYHEFADVFSKKHANTLAPHRQYDLKINLEDGKEPPLGHMYSLSGSELSALREFIPSQKCM